MDAAGSFVKSVVASFVVHEGDQENEEGDAHGHAGDFDQGIELVLEDVPEADLEVVEQHSDLLPRHNGQQGICQLPLCWEKRALPDDAFGYKATGVRLLPHFFFNIFDCSVKLRIDAF